MNQTSKRKNNHQPTKSRHGTHPELDDQTEDTLPSSRPAESRRASIPAIQSAWVEKQQESFTQTDHNAEEEERTAE
ncbi:hypothetical protein BLNAU_11733 [Blattamonas nauphoetae]|uniref:Uncharacterized protein n=1 Tax=Blattamonas nauphoetae TaxID=2049346 RepID=A0ABQ9XP35_9EUKA|nr:hypothetical protein BLNAU_11733 [Blattamonas nauphoetae]